MAYLPERSCLAEGPAILGIGFRREYLKVSVAPLTFVGGVLE